MARLTHRAFEILRAEVHKCAAKDRLSQLEKKLVLEDLEQLRSQAGAPASLEELRKIVIITYPKFSEKVLEAAARANRSSSVWKNIKLAVLLLIGSILGLGALGAIFNVRINNFNSGSPFARGALGGSDLWILTIENQ